MKTGRNRIPYPTVTCLFSDIGVDIKRLHENLYQYVAEHTPFIPAGAVLLPPTNDSNGPVGVVFFSRGELPLDKGADQYRLASAIAGDRQAGHGIYAVFEDEADFQRLRTGLKMASTSQLTGEQVAELAAGKD